MLHQVQNTPRIAARSTIGALALVFALVLGGAVWTHAQAQTAPPGPQLLTRGGITVVGEGTITVEPDIAQANIGVEAVHESVRAASDEAEAGMDALLEALTALGIAERDIQTSSYSIYSERGMMPEMGEMDRDLDAVRYRVNNQVQVTIRDLDAVGQVLDAAIDAGANQVYGVQFMLDDPASYEGDARRAAIENARAKAEELAALSGVTLGPVMNVSEVIGDIGIPFLGVETMVADGRGAAGTPILPGEFDLTVRIQVTYGLSDAAGQAGAPPAQPESEFAPPQIEPTVTPPTGDKEESNAETGVETAGETAVETIVEPGGFAPHPAPATSMEMVATTSLMAGALPEVSVEGGDEAALRRFIETSLQPIFPGAPMTTISITIGDLPAQLPFDLTLDDDLEVIGSTVREGDFAMTEIMLIGPAPAADWADDLRSQLTDQGYFIAQAGMPREQVFQSSQDMTATPFCSPDRDLAVYIMAGESEDEARIRLTVNPLTLGRDSLCDPAFEAGPRFGYPGLPEGLLPTLEAPTGVTMFGMGSGGSDRHFEANAQIQASELTAQEIYDIWSADLEAQGWSLVAEEGGAYMAWSLWNRELDGQTWTGVFNIMRHSGDETQFMAALRVERDR